MMKKSLLWTRNESELIGMLQACCVLWSLMSTDTSCFARYIHVCMCLYVSVHSIYTHNIYIYIYIYIYIKFTRVLAKMAYIRESMTLKRNSEHDKMLHAHVHPKISPNMI
jgi:hypothetical protein